MVRATRTLISDTYGEIQKNFPVPSPLYFKANPNLPNTTIETYFDPTAMKRTKSQIKQAVKGDVDSFI